MLKKIARGHGVKLMLLVLFIYFIGIAFVCYQCSDAVHYYTADNLFEMSDSEREDMLLSDTSTYMYASDLVAVDLKYVLDSYASDDTGVYYIVPVGDAYMSLYVENDYDRDISTLCDKTWEYLQSEDDEGNWETLAARGAVMRLSDLEYQYMYEWFEDSGFMETGIVAEDGEINIYDFSFYYQSQTEWITLFFRIMIALALIAVLSLFVVLPLLITRPYRVLKAQILSDSLSEDEINEDLSNAKQYKSLCIGDKWLLGFEQTGNNNDGGSAILFQFSKVVWCFKYVLTVQQRSYGIKVGSTVHHCVRFITRDGLVHTYGMRDERECLALIDDIAGRNLPIIIGHSDELAQLFTTNRANFIAMADDYTANHDFRNISI